jgi:hypothetical protein
MTKHQHVGAAAEILTHGPDAHLRYAALELRLAIEAIAYEKLSLYAPRLPAAILEKWQPPQAFKALEEFEPRSTHSFRLRIAEEVEYGVPGTEWHEMGEHRAFKLPWLRTTYNKLGGLIHHKSPNYEANAELSSITDARRLRAALLSIHAEVERVASSQIDGSMATVIELTCTVCDTLIVRNLDGAKASYRADCLQTACGAQHHLEIADDGTVSMQLIATAFDCMNCKSPIVVENRKLEIGLEFTCSVCSAKHVIATRQWGYGISGAVEA